MYDKNVFLAKAQENLEGALLLLETHRWNGTANRAYYSALQASVAALLHEGFPVERVDHRTTHGDFVAKLIHGKKLYPLAVRSYLSEMRQVREDADYTALSISHKQAARQVRKAEEFFTLIQQRVHL